MGHPVLLVRAKSQVLLVDVQERLLPAMVGPASGTGAGPAEVIAGCRTLLLGAAALAVPVTVSEQYPKGLGPTVAELAALVPQDRVFAKMEFSCYANEALRAQLERAGRPQVVLAGIEAHVCVLQSGLELAAHGFQVFVVADAVASRRTQSREVALQRLAGAGVTPVTVEMVLFEWLRSAAVPEFRTISKLIR